MKYRQFGKTGVSVSEVGVGTWQLGGADWGDVPEHEALQLLRRSAELGVTLIDTADVYGNGRSETIIGKFLKETNETIYVATKLGRLAEPGWPQNFTLDVMRQHVQGSVQRLGVESLFLEQLHCIPTEEYRKGEVFEHLRQLKKEGLIQHWGVSVESVEEGLLCLQQDGCATLQVIYNIFRQKLTDELLPQAKAKGVGILARVPLASGLLAGKFKADHKFAENDHRHYNADGQAFNAGETFAGVPFQKGVQLTDEIRRILQPGGQVTMAQKALRWVLDNEAVSAVIPGATKLGQAESNAHASALPPLGDAAHHQLRDLYLKKIHSSIRGKY